MQQRLPVRLKLSDRGRTRLRGNISAPWSTRYSPELEISPQKDNPIELVMLLWRKAAGRLPVPAGKKQEPAASRA
jgi:hypothetical protein